MSESVFVRHALVSSLALIVLAVISLPVVILFGVALNAGDQQLFPPAGLSLRWFFNIFKRQSFLDAMLFSFELAVVATLLCLIAATLLSIAIVRLRFPGRDLLLALSMAPIAIPQVVTGLALLVACSMLGVTQSVPAILALHVMLGLPLATRMMVASLTRFNISTEMAARSLGASPLRAFASVSLPAIRPGMTAAAVFSFAASFENFTATQFLIWDRSTLPVEIFSYVQSENDPTGAAISALVVLISAALVIGFRRFINLETFNQR